MFPEKNIRIPGKTKLFPSGPYLVYSFLFVCFTLGGGTNTGQALKVTQNNVLEPALANPLTDLETVQVILIDVLIHSLTHPFAHFSLFR